MRIKDRILLGVISGLVGAIPGRLLNSIEYDLGYVDSKYGQMAASQFINKKKINTPLGKLLGSAANGILAATTGVAVTYTLSATGRDRAVLKGIGVASLYWVLLYAISTRLGKTAKHIKPASPLLSLVDHLIFGTMSGIISSECGDDSLFPDGRIKSSQHKLPLIYTN